MRPGYRFLIRPLAQTERVGITYEYRVSQITNVSENTSRASHAILRHRIGFRTFHHGCAASQRVAGPLGRIGPQQPLLIVKGNDRGDTALTKWFWGFLFPFGAGFTKGECTAKMIS